MKSVYLYRLRLPLLLTRTLIIFLKVARVPAHHWGDSGLPGDYVKALVFPPAALSTTFESQSRRHVGAYFKARAGKIAGTDRYRFDYVRKWIDVRFLDYYAFRKTVENHPGVPVRPATLGRAFLGAIYENRMPSCSWRCLVLLVAGPIVLTLRTAHGVLLCLHTNPKKRIPGILFLRKKVYPDLGTFSELRSILNDSQASTFDGTYMAFNSAGEKHEISFINRYQGAARAITLAYCQSLMSLAADVWYFFTRGVDYECASRFVIDNFIASIVTRLGSRFICGVLVDKPANILLSRHKQSGQQILALNESFFFPPGRSFDYNHLDVYYSLNDIDESMQNLFGGEIREFKRVEFFRRTKAPSKGISGELKSRMQQFRYRIVTAPAQIFVERSGYYYWAYDELEKFILANIQLANANPDILVIIKGKKGELATLPDRINRELDAAPNIFVVHSVRPRDLEFNHLEDILENCDLLVSMCHTSTTIWQALATNKPFIAINDIHPPTFLRQYDGFECNLAEIGRTVGFWRSQSDSEKNIRLDALAQRVNLGASRGIQQIAEDMVQRLRQ